MMNNERIQEAERALDEITLGFPGLQEELTPSVVASVKTLRYMAQYRQWRSDSGWHADLSIFHRNGVIVMGVTPNVDYWTTKNIKRVSREAYRRYKNYKMEEK